MIAFERFCRIFPAVVGMLALMLAGCRSARLPNRDVSHPCYERSELKDSLRDLVVRLNLRDCPEKQVIRYTSWLGQRRTEKPHALKFLLQGEFDRVIRENFSAVGGTRPRRAKVELNVTVNRIDLFDPYFGDVCCSYAFSVKLLDPRSNVIKPFFEKVYAVERHGPIVDGVIPDCEYQAIQDVATEFINAVAADKEVIRLLEDCCQEQPPEISDWQPRHLTNNAIRGNAYVVCNDWNRDASQTWAKRQIFKRAASEMRLEESEEILHLYFFRESYEENTGRWNFEFDAVQHDSLVILPRNEGDWKCGRCYVDIKALKAKNANQALAIAKRKILDKALSEGVDGVSVELKRPYRDPYFNDVLVADFQVK